MKCHILVVFEPYIIFFVEFDVSTNSLNDTCANNGDWLITKRKVMIFTVNLIDCKITYLCKTNYLYLLVFKFVRV